MIITQTKKLIALLCITIFIVYTIKRLLFNPLDLLAAHKPPPVSIQTITVTSKTLPTYLEAIGSLRAESQVTLAPEIPGRILRLPFESGKSVKTNDIVIVLDDEVEQADLKRAKAQLALAKVSLDRAQSLASKKVESLANLDQKKADFNQAGAAVALAEARVNQKKIRAPFSGDLGIFTDKINIGHYVQPGESLITLTNRQRLYVNFSLDEKVRPRVYKGQKVLITTDAYPHHSYEGIITSIDPQIKEQTRGIMLQATIDNTDLSLFPGMYARLQVALEVKPKSLLIPETAINYTLYGSSVFIVQKNEQNQEIVMRQPIQVGARLRDAVEVISGLKEGDVIVAIGQAKLDNGALVKVDNGKPLPSLQNLKA